MFSKIFDFFENFRDFEKFSENFWDSTLTIFHFRYFLWIFLRFFLNPNEFSWRIRLVCQKLHHNSLEEIILHLETLCQLTQDSILKQGYLAPVS